ncbi:hypothetical protein [Muricoccus radiodurans]|uniref:hypothetical protein n=1 Tax=Muricoccus radiodurans TaxID=2231721 RepID=UPI003CEAAFCC
MDPYTRLLFLMARWWRNPPSRRALIAMGVALAVCILLVTVERTVGWPDWLRTERVPMRRLPAP